MKKFLIGTILIISSLNLISCNDLTPSNSQPTSKEVVQNNANKETISLKKAKEIALKHANLTSNEVSFVKANKEYDDGIEKYEIEFYHNNKEFKYEINTTNGEILSYEFE